MSAEIAGAQRLKPCARVDCGKGYAARHSDSLPGYHNSACRYTAKRERKAARGVEDLLLWALK